MKGLLFLYGDCFREGMNQTTLSNTPASYSNQKEASLSHMEFCDEMKKKGVSMEVLIHTYHTKYEKDLRSWYKCPTEYIGKRRFPFKTSREALDSFMKIGKNIDHTYDFVIMTRMDILLKPAFMKVVNPKWDKLYFFSKHINLSLDCTFFKGVLPSVNPMIEFIPKRYFCVLNKLNVDHDAWATYVGIEKDFMINEHYSADTYKYYNPYYKIVGRPESHIHSNKNKKIRNTTQKLKCKKYKEHYIK